MQQYFLPRDKLIMSLFLKLVGVMFYICYLKILWHDGKVDQMCAGIAVVFCGLVSYKLLTFSSSNDKKLCLFKIQKLGSKTLTRQILSGDSLGGENSSSSGKYYKTKNSAQTIREKVKRNWLNRI